MSKIPCLFKYYGETNRNGYSRGGEHLYDSQSQTLEGIEKSIIANHSWLHHEGKLIKLKVKMLNNYRCDPTGRQNAEAIHIRNAPAELLINSKAEHIQPCDIKERYEKIAGAFEQAKLEKRTKTEKIKLRTKIQASLIKDDKDLVSNNLMETAIINQNSNPSLIFPKISTEARSLPTRSSILLGNTDLSSPTVPIISNSPINLSEQMPVLVKSNSGINIGTTKNEFPFANQNTSKPA